MIKILLIRHASPDWTRKDLPYYFPPGPPLTAQGMFESEMLANFLRFANVRRLFSSPLERCYHTAQIISTIVGIPFELRQGLIEWQPDENRGDVFNRLWPVFEEAYAYSKQSEVVGLISHGGPIGLLLFALGMDEARLASHRKYDHGNPLPPAGVWEAVSVNGENQPWKLSLEFNPQQVNFT